MKVIKQATYGRIRTHNKVTYTGHHGYRRWKDKILKYKQNNNYKTGYRVTLWKDGKPHDLLVCRLVATTFLENLIDTQLTVNHINGNRLDNRVKNLEWLSIADNIKHGFATNLYSTQKNCKLINKKNNKEYTFMSLSKASCFLGRNKAYVSNNLKAGRKIKDINNQEYNIILL